MSEYVIPKGTIVTLLTSFCGNEFTDCTDSNPCRECVNMCNTYEMKSNTWAIYRGQVDKEELELG